MLLDSSDIGLGPVAQVADIVYHSFTTVNCRGAPFGVDTSVTQLVIVPLDLLCPRSSENGAPDRADLVIQLVEGDPLQLRDVLEAYQKLFEVDFPLPLRLNFREQNV